MYQHGAAMHVDTRSTLRMSTSLNTTPRRRAPTVPGMDRSRRSKTQPLEELVEKAHSEGEKRKASYHEIRELRRCQNAEGGQLCFRVNFETVI